MSMFWLGTTIFLLDRLSKWYIQQNFLPDMTFPVIPNIFHITYVLNPGAAFGLLEYQTGFFITIAILMMAGVIFFYRQIPKEMRLLRIGLTLLFAGALGNVIDRATIGYVVDFFDFRIWPVFNIADIAIVTGVMTLIYHLGFENVRE